MKVIEAKGSRSRTTTTIETEIDAPKSVRKEINGVIGEFLVEQVRISLGKSSTPVSGESWPALSPDYKKRKKSFGDDPVPNMELTGDMLDSLDFRATADGVEIGFFDDQSWKADGHLKFSGKKGLAPKRRFLPGKGESFKQAIEREVDSIIADELLSRGEG